MERFCEEGNDSDDSVELSQENISAAFNSLSNLQSPEINTAFNFNGSAMELQNVNSYLHIVEQPQSRGFRFRYKCEGPSHGGLQGVNSKKSKKSYPTVQIMNYEGPAKIVVSLVTDDTEPKTHAHELVGKSCDKGICLLDVKEAKNPICQLQNVGVMHVTKRKVADVLKDRILESMLLNKRICSGNINNENIQLQEDEKHKAKEEAEIQAKNMHLNVVRLCFQAYLLDKPGNTPIISVISNAIYDSKSPGAAALKICRMDKYGGCCTGNEEVFLLCDKVQKDDIKVVFIEMDQNQCTIWREEADFGPTDVHKQFAIVFKTPKYRNIDIKDPVSVFIKLERPSDSECSEPKVFTYYPQNPDEDGIARKRRKVLPTISGCDELLENLNDTANQTFPKLSCLDQNLFLIPNEGAADNNMNIDIYTGTATNSSSLSTAEEMSQMYMMDQQQQLDDCNLFDPNQLYFDAEDLETDSVPCNNTMVKCRESMILKDFSNLDINTEKKRNQDFKRIDSSKLDRNKEDEQNKEETIKKVLVKQGPIKEEKRNPNEFCKEFSDLVKKETQETEQPKINVNPKKKPEAPKTKIPFLLDFLMALRNFSTNGRIQDLLMKCRNLILIPDKYGDNCLHLALINNQSDVVQNLLPIVAALPEDLNISNHRFQTGLHLAVLTNQPKMVDLLLKQKIKRTLVDWNGNTAVHLAVKYGHIKCLESLLKEDLQNQAEGDQFLDLDMLNYEGYSPLHLACLKSSLESLKLLIEAKAEVNLPDGKSGRTPLHIAVENNDLLLTGELLLEADCDPNCVTFDGNTPLHLACGRNYETMVALLMSVGADSEVADWCLSDDSEAENDTENNQLFYKGKKPRDLVYNNEKILQILDGEEKSHARESSYSHFDSKEYLQGELGDIPYERRKDLAKLVDSFEGIENWKSLAKHLELEYFIDKEQNVYDESPTLFLLDMYEVLGGQLKDLHSAFIKLNMKDAASFIDQIQKGKDKPSSSPSPISVF